MRPNVSETRDPLNVSLLPTSVGAMELNYRTMTNPNAVPHVWLITSCSALCIAVFFVTRLLLQLQAQSFAIAVMGAVAAFILVAAGVAWSRGKAATGGLLALSAPVLTITLVTPASPAGVWIGVLFAATLTVRLSMACIEHAAAWYSADLRVTIADRRRLLAVWNSRSFDRGFREADDDRQTVRATEVRERESLRRRLAIVILSFAVGLALQLLLSRNLTESFLIMLSLTGSLVAIGLQSIRDYCTQTGRPREAALSDLRRGLIVWFGYNRHETRAPGVMLSPAGFASQRAAQFWIAFAVFCAICGLACSYFAGPLRTAGECVRWPLRSTEQGSRVFFGRETESRFNNAGGSAVAHLRRPVEGRILIGLVADLPRRWPALVFGLAGCAVFPPLAFAAVLLALCGRTLVHFGAMFGADSPYLREITDWHAAVERLRRSRNRLESEHIWLGVAIETDSPVIMHRQLAAEHVHLLGSTGSNKTSVGVTQLLEQLIGPESSLLILDLKGDMALFESARLTATNARDRCGMGRPIRFRWFTTESERSSYAFNPLSQSYLQRLPRLERTQILSRALGLEHGEGYGRGHFSSANRNALLKLLTVCPDVDSFRKLHEEGRRQKKLFTTWEREHASDFFSAIHTLANIDALNLTSRDYVDPTILSNAIDMNELIREPTIAYFRLPATSQAAANREVAKLALYGLLTAVRQLGRAGRQIYIVIDEFQQLVSTDLSIILQQARSYGIGIIMAHQTQSDLKLPETDMTQVVEENTHFKQIFSVNDLGHRQALEALSGEALYHMAGWKQGAEAYADDELVPGIGLPPSDPTAMDVEVSITASIGPRLRANDLIEMSARPNLCMVQFKRNVGYGQYDGFPFLMRADYHISRKVYLERLSAPWPLQNSATGLIVTPLPDACFFYQIGVEKPSVTRQAPLPFLETPAGDGTPQPNVTVTNPPPSTGESVRPAPDRNPIAEALDSL